MPWPPPFEVDEPVPTGTRLGLRAGARRTALAAGGMASFASLACLALFAWMTYAADADEKSRSTPVAFARGAARPLDGDRALGANANLMREGSWDDPEFSAATKNLFRGAGALRYPGGTLSNYWNWTRGWCLENYTDTACKGVAERPYYVDEFARGLTATGASGFLSLNVLTSTLNDSLALLNRSRDLGFPFSIELGNEIYWGKYSDWYANGTTYGAAMATWIDAIRAAGHENWIYLACATAERRRNRRGEVWPRRRGGSSHGISTS